MKIGDVELHEGSNLVINYDQQLSIVNLDQLSRGTGARYLEVLPVRDPDNKLVYVAKAWRRRTHTGSAFVDFGRRR